MPPEATSAAVVLSVPLELEGVTAVPLELAVRIVRGPAEPDATDGDPFAPANAVGRPGN